MTKTQQSQTPLELGEDLSRRLNPELRAILEARYDGLVPGFTDTLIEFAMAGSMPATGSTSRPARSPPSQR